MLCVSKVALLMQKFSQCSYCILNKNVGIFIITLFLFYNVAEMDSCILSNCKQFFSGEIDRCLKKVAEGVEQFDDIWKKVPTLNGEY